MARAIGHSHPSPHHSIVRVTGDLDLATAPLLREVLTSADADPMHEFVVELAGVTFMDCSGLAPLLEVHAMGGGRLRLCDPSQAVSRLLHLVGLDEVFATDRAAPAVLAEVAAAPATPGRDPRRTRPPGTSVEEVVPVGADVEHAGFGDLELQAAGSHEAIESATVIEQARGVLMASLGCDAKQAAHALLQVSWAHDATVVDAAVALVAAAEDSRLQTETAELASADLDRAAQEGSIVV